MKKNRTDEKDYFGHIDSVEKDYVRVLLFEEGVNIVDDSFKIKYFKGIKPKEGRKVIYHTWMGSNGKANGYFEVLKSRSEPLSDKQRGLVEKIEETLKKYK